MPTYRFSRRLFAAGLAAAPSLLPAQNPPASAADRPSPFAGPLEFHRHDIVPKAHPFAMSEVRLLPGPFQQAAEANRAYMGRLPAERLLHSFKLNAGLPSAAEPLGGWEAPSSEIRGHCAGHYLSACALRYASAGDQQIKARGDQMVAELARCQSQLNANGYLSAFPTEFFDRLDQGKKVWVPFYTIHKIMAGLLDMHLHAGNRQALEVAGGMADWADGWTAARSESHMQEILKTEFGGMSEVLYNLAASTGEEKWARAGDRFTKKTFVTPLGLRRDELKGLHANTHIPQAIAAARRYEISGDPRFHDAAQFFWHTVADARSYATGGTSNREFWRADPGRLAQEWHDGKQHQECCCAYNMLKLTRRLYQWSGDPRYFDYYERVLFNHRLGAIQPSTGHSMYFLSLTPGAWKTWNTEDRSFWCCTGTALEEFSKLTDSIYYQDSGGISVNLFIASALDAKEKGVALRQETRFPGDPRTAIVIESAPLSAFALRLRIPAWADGASAKLNGRPIEAMAGGGAYLHLSRTWQKGDRVDLELPMRLTAEAMPDDPTLQAFLYGPIVLAGDLGSEGLADALIQDQQGPDTDKAPMEVPGLKTVGEDPAQWLKPSGAGAMDFLAAEQSRDLAFGPLNRLWQRFAVYWKVA